MHDRDAGLILSMIAAIWFLVFVVVVGLHLFNGYCYKKIALKLGNDEDAKLWWIPIAHTLILIRAAGRPDWWLALQFVPLANIITLVIVWTEVAEALGKSTGWGVLAALFPMPIGQAYLAFSEPEEPLRIRSNDNEDVVIQWKE